MPAIDPFRLDRSLRTYTQRYVDFRLALRSGPAEEHVFELLPRELSDEGLDELAHGGSGSPLLQAALPIAQWLRVEHALLEARRQEAIWLRHTRLELDQPVRGSFTLAELKRELLSDRDRRRGFRMALAAQGERLAEARLRRWEREAELHAAYGRTPARLGTAAEREVPEALLRETDAAYAELALPDFEAYLERALGRDVPGQFPRRLSLRALAEYFSDSPLLRGLGLQAYAPPEMLGASSFVLGLAGFGGRFHEAASKSDQSFVMHFDLQGIGRAEWSGLFALLPATRPFAARYLDITRSRYAEYARRFGQTWLAGLRGLALRAALVEPGLSGERKYRATHRDLVPRALGFEVEPKTAGVLWVDDTAITRLSGVLLAAGQLRELTEVYDEDWFRNPRAVEELRERLRTVTPGAVEPARLAAGLQQLVRWLLDLLS